MVEAMAFQVRDVIDAMAATAHPLSALRVDGGASVMDLLLQMLADQIRVPVARPASLETTALGAATLAGLAEGVWASLDELAALWEADRVFEPQLPSSWPTPPTPCGAGRSRSRRVGRPRNRPS